MLYRGAKRPGGNESFRKPAGLRTSWRDEGWTILKRRGLTLEFFPQPGLDPARSWFSRCLRLDDVMPFYDSIAAAGVPEATRGWPRLHRPQREAGAAWSARWSAWPMPTTGRNTSFWVRMGDSMKLVSGTQPVQVISSESPLGRAMRGEM